MFCPECWSGGSASSPCSSHQSRPSRERWGIELLSYNWPFQKYNHNFSAVLHQSNSLILRGAWAIASRSCLVCTRPVCAFTLGHKQLKHHPKKHTDPWPENLEYVSYIKSSRQPWKRWLNMIKLPKTTFGLFLSYVYKLSVSVWKSAHFGAFHGCHGCDEGFGQCWLAWWKIFFSSRSSGSHLLSDSVCRCLWLTFKT